MSRHKYQLYLGWVLASVCGTFWSGASAQNVTSADFPDCTGYGPYIQDGHCDEINNIADCGWDGGDCCPCTCLGYLEHDCGVLTDFDCVDPDVPDDCGATPSPAAAFGYPDCTGYMYDLGDGNCDEDLNNEECGYDGGDCCRCTCTSYYGCDGGTFDCKDPEAPDDCETESPTPSPAASYGYPDCTGYMYYHQNGYCSDDLNNEECGYDGGDCCRCTCRTLSIYDSECSGSFDCKDPEAPDDCPTPSPTPSPAASYGYPDCEGYLYDFQNGNCDDDLNNAECGFDGGDCCSCTCESSRYTCGSYNSYNCLDPDAECAYSTSAETTDDDTSLCSDSSRVGNGYCSYDLNTKACDYDGGDCCECTCPDTGTYDCGLNGYDCLDPDACSSTSSSGSEISEAASSSNPSTPSSSSSPFSTALIVVLAFFGVGILFICQQFICPCRVCKTDARHPGSRAPPPPVASQAGQPGRPHGTRALSYNPWRESAPPPAPRQVTPAWYLRVRPGSSSRQSNAATGPCPPQAVRAPPAPPQPNAPPVVYRPSVPQVLPQPVSAASRSIAPTRSTAARQQRAPRTAVFGPAPDTMLQGRPDTGGAWETNTHVMQTSLQESERLAALDERKRVQMAIEESKKVKTIAEAMYKQESDIADVAKALAENEGAAVEGQHDNCISCGETKADEAAEPGGETKSDKAAEPTDVSVADESDYSASEWSDDEDCNVDAEPSPPPSAPLVAEGVGGDDMRKQSTRKAEAGNDSEAKEEPQTCQTTREPGELSVKRGKQVEASSEGTEGAQNDDTASESTDTVEALAGLGRGNGAPSDLGEKNSQEGENSGERNGESSGAETGGSDHGARCAQSMEGGPQTTSKHALENKVADVRDEVVEDEEEIAPPGMAVTGSGEVKGEGASHEETDESKLGSVEEEPEVTESTATEDTIGAGSLRQPPATEGVVGSEDSPTPTEDGGSPTMPSGKTSTGFKQDDSEGKEGNVDGSEDASEGAQLRAE